MVVYSSSYFVSQEFLSLFNLRFMLISIKLKVINFFYLLWKSYLDCILSILIEMFAFTSEWKFTSTLKIPILLSSLLRII